MCKENYKKKDIFGKKYLLYHCDCYSDKLCGYNFRKLNYIIYFKGLLFVN